MQNLKDSVSIKPTTKQLPDYTGDRQAAGELSRRIQAYYHDQNYKAVRVWVEPILSSSGKKLWGIRSNIVFNVAKLQTDGI